MSIDSIDVETGLPRRAAAEAQAFKIRRRRARQLKLFDPVMVRQAMWRSFVMLDPRNMMRNPVMFLVEVGTLLTAIVTAQSIMNGSRVRPDRLSGIADFSAPHHSALRQLRRGAGRGSWQGPG